MLQSNMGRKSFSPGRTDRKPDKFYNTTTKGIHQTALLNMWKEGVQVMWMCLLFFLIILMNFKLS